LSNDDVWEIARGLSHQQRAEVLGVPYQWKVKKEKNTTQFDQEWLNCKAEISSRAKKSPAQRFATKDVLPASSSPLGKLNRVPDLPRNFLQRPNELEALKGLVLSGTEQPVGCIRNVSCNCQP
jgi:hypothetical protein